MIGKIKKFFAAKDGSRVKVPTILQMESVECGAAALAMILASFGRWVPLEKMRQECGVNRDGSKAANILKAAKHLGLEAKAFRWKADTLKKKTLPMIIHWEFNHFVVLEGIIGDVAYLNDPAMGRRKVPWKDFSTSYTGIAMTFKPDENFRREGQRYSVVKAISEKLAQDKVAMIFVMLIGAAMIFPGLASPVFNQIFLDDILSGKHPDWMPKLCLAMIGTIILTGILNILRTILLTRWQKKLTLSDSSRFFWHVLRLPMTFFQQRYAGEIASRVSFIDLISRVLANQAATAVLDFLIALFYLALLFQYSVTLTIIGVSFSVVDLIVFFLLRRQITDMNMQVQQALGKEFGVAVNGLAIIETIKANGNESDFFAKWAGYHSKALIGTQEVQMKSLTMNVLPTLLTGINSALIITLGGFSIMEGVMTAGIFTAFQNLMGRFQEPVDKMVKLGTTLQTTEMQMQRLDDVYRYQVDGLNYPEETRANNFNGTRLSGEIELRNVNFGYSPLEPPLLENFNLHVEPGRWVAIVGFSGSGKSTLSKILTGFYEEWSGDVLFDGVIRREIPRDVIVNSLSSVDQDIFQITGTVRENITLFDTSAKKDDVIRAAQDACIHDDILKLEGGYEAQVFEGGLNFSGGQRQRLEIARALANNPSILVLDEATSALDPVTEKIVLENIRRRGCSCFIVAHRLSTIRDCDEIIVLDKGKVVERGTHREMIQHDGAYRRLIQGSTKNTAEASQ